jgi:general stress protein CsbA|tara:strand:+ start:402 stop:518 length:117 start_codon:yes stop_codon:yes gene_type:complete
MNLSFNIVFWGITSIVIVYLLIKKIGAEKKEDFDKRDN